ncbi:cupin domain-containing protein [Pseudomonas gingeri NCPPB 3146 = LMG 5327]|uniref:Cupin domain-containing protein n=2 Tax=Pseudomonas gingeri TaxID=117681 RepID=A0A7Y7XVP8_9PSED|nr:MULTISPECIES: cupin domain-containing protein [Pseudomonas]NVZ24768.1 cupin domain-containing protein [Pseudomonas gingeri]NWA05623.1 cupin domain-containing protein [Pseudomonas gingeri]NWC13202.1 cupin domain-containing protein [Pseudomonas gingeri]NWE45388.1 cupin domain-containing protein [Pseudomonas gingeri]PNQ92650.1 cupin domain-containing protein [Pseudomonas gingeri NCPPB 3146 = LMG 5327]
MKTLKFVTSTLIAATLLASTGAFAHEAGSSQEKITVLQEHPLLNAPGKKAMMLTVDYLPGQSSIAHKHQGTAMAYVLEGEITSQVKGEQAITYKAGQSWYEPAGSEHLVSKNASDKKPARLLVFMFMDEKDAVLIPLNQ